jgi:hypothetical protein
MDQILSENASFGRKAKDNNGLIVPTTMGLCAKQPTHHAYFLVKFGTLVKLMPHLALAKLFHNLTPGFDVSEN